MNQFIFILYINQVLVLLTDYFFIGNPNFIIFVSMLVFMAI